MRCFKFKKINPRSGNVIGFAGKLGSGKSFIANKLMKYGYKVIDSDCITAKILRENHEVGREVVRLFPECKSFDGCINKQILSDIVFSNTRDLRRLESVLHPAVKQECNKMINIIKGKRTIIMLIPLLIEQILEKSPHLVNVDQIVLVVADEHLRLKRSLLRLQMTKEKDDFISKRQYAARAKQKFANLEIKSNNPHFIRNILKRKFSAGRKKRRNST